MHDNLIGGRCENVALPKAASCGCLLVCTVTPSYCRSSSACFHAAGPGCAPALKQRFRDSCDAREVDLPPATATMVSLTLTEVLCDGFSELLSPLQGT